MVGSQQQTTVHGRTMNEQPATVNDIKTPLNAISRFSTLTAIN